jgi:decaprenylphospho-beta-D-ribofuranose 2-oxidase
VPALSPDPATLSLPPTLPAPAERSRPAAAGEQRLLCGWGRTAPTRAWLLRPRTAEEVADALAGSPESLAARSARRSPRGGVIARGAGRSYGDAAQCGGGAVIDATALRGVLELDAARGVVRAGAGRTFAELLLFLAARELTLPVVPGTRHVTVGGALAANVHGKNHLRDGSLSRHVESFTLCTPADGLRPVSPERESDLFDATLGGMGLTGVVVDAALRVVPLRSARAVADTDRLDSLEQAVALLAGAQSHRYAIAWVDLLSEGAAFGRSVLTRSDEGPPAAGDAFSEPPLPRPDRAVSPHGTRARRPRGGPATEAGRHRPLAGIPVSTEAGRHSPSARIPVSASGGTEGSGAAPFSLRPALTVPRGFPGGLLRPAVVRAFNALHWRSAPRSERGRYLSMGAQLFPLDALGAWSRLYGPAGLVQYQFAVPLGCEDALLRVVHRLRARRLPMYLAVLKRFGPSGPDKSGPLSFPLEGLTLAIDLPAGAPGLYGALEEADAVVAGAGGRVYLAKDARLRPSTLAAMYPELERFRELRARVDPDGVLRSDLGRRLGLCR